MATRPDLGAVGGATPNLPSSFVDWSKLKGVPPGIADGTDDAGPAYSAGAGISIANGVIAAAAIPWAAIADPPADKDTTYTNGPGLILGSSGGNNTFSVDSTFVATRAALAATTGPTGLVDWSKLKNVPAGLNDGDNDTTYTADATSGISVVGTKIAMRACANGQAYVYSPTAGWQCTSLAMTTPGFFETSAANPMTVIGGSGEAHGSDLPKVDMLCHVSITATLLSPASATFLARIAVRTPGAGIFPDDADTGNFTAVGGQPEPARLLKSGESLTRTLAIRLKPTNTHNLGCYVAASPPDVTQDGTKFACKVAYTCTPL